jgi:chromosome segregation protein
LYLKKIKILGFKSFADSTVLEFHPGITAIVGPNGCGKSNISDAFRWVLGEQSAKSMRGNKMQDVIFAGTTKRKPLNLCEVAITLGDVGDTLKTDYDEVAVARRIHRSGESDYLVNKRAVRLRDVYDLFMDSGIGKNAFSIFEQGKIEQVIQLSPLERRYIFEEAAGILRFLQRKKEALRRLEQTEGNIDRVRDIHREVERQIVILERQAEQARLYKEHKSALESLEIALAAHRLGHFLKKREAFELKEQEKRSELNAATLSLEKLEVERQNGNIRLNQTIKELHTYKEEVFKARSRKEIQTKSWQSQEERIQEMVRQESDWRRELEQMVQKRTARRQESEQLQRKQKEVEEELTKLESVRRDQRENLNAIESEVNALRDRQHAEQHERMLQLQAENAIESEQKQTTLKLEHYSEKIDRLQENQHTLREHHAELCSSKESKTREMSKTAEELQGLKEEFALLGSRIEELSVGIKQIQEEFDRCYQDSTEMKARRKALIRLREEMEGFSKGTKRLIQESSREASPLFQKVKGMYEDFPVEGCDEEALVVVMKRYAQTLVVESKVDFETVTAYAREHCIKDFSLICLETVSNQLSPIGPQSLLNTMEEHPLTHHFLKNVVIKEKAVDGLLLPEGEAWTKEGVYFDRYRVAFFPAVGEENAFLREAELKSLERNLEECENRRSLLEESRKALVEERQVLQARKSEKDQLIRQEEVKLVEKKYALERMEMDAEKCRLEIEKEQAEYLSLKELSGTLQQALSELNLRHAEHRSLITQSKKQVEELDAQLQAKWEQLKINQSVMEEKESAYHKVADENRKITHQLNVFEVKDFESLQQEKRLEEEIRAVQEKRSSIQLNRVDFTHTIEEIERVLQETLERCSEWELSAADQRGEVEAFEQSIAAKREAIRLLEKELHEQGMQRVQVDTAREALEAEFFQRFQRTLRDACSEARELEEPMEKAERRIRDLRKKIEDAGDINMTSIEEYDHYKERYDFLNRQIDDLTASKEELVEIITKLDCESRKVFKETFQVIQANFRKNFEVLFRGGEADLQFTESGDILEAGIEIVAKPPGKKMRSISLMSGGEKCLTAVALLFAIFEVKPSPFCILDEIDAPLDDTNVERFLNVVKQYTDRCQFIIITHNKRTMAIADRLFGVSMQERGVSKILSLEFDKESSREPALVS